MISNRSELSRLHFELALSFAPGEAGRYRGLIEVLTSTLQGLSKVRVIEESSVGSGRVEHWTSERERTAPGGKLEAAGVRRIGDREFVFLFVRGFWGEIFFRLPVPVP